MTADISGFERFPFTHDGRTRDVYRAGSGPAVIVLHEMPGLHPGVVDFGRRLLDQGYTVYMPSLFGRVNAEKTGRELLRSIARTCVSREFHLLADRTSPIISWLRVLAAQAHDDCGGPGVGAVGMCFTGGFALAMAVEPAVLAPVLSQPGLPIGLGARRKAALGLDVTDVTVLEQRRETGLCAMGLRFTADKTSPRERFETLERLLGKNFFGIEIDSSPGNEHGIPSGAHSVLTTDLVDEPGHPTRRAVDEVMAFLAERLRPAAA